MTLRRPVRLLDQLSVLWLAAFAILAILPANAQTANPLQQLRIGYQKYGTLVLLKASGALEKRLAPQGISIIWTEFPGGVRLLEALNVGSIDFGTTGDGPPVIAQAAGAPLVYAGYEPPTPKGEALIVHADSPIQSVADLKGKKIAIVKGGNIHHLLIGILEKAGLKSSDIEAVFLASADGRAAFERRSVDAWVGWDPFLAKVETDGGVRVIADGNYAGVNNTQFYLASRKLAEEHPELVKTILEEIAAIDAYTQSHITEASEALAKEIGLNTASVQLALSRMGYGVRPIDDKTLAEQQVLADRFFKNGVIPAAIDVRQATAGGPK